MRSKDESSSIARAVHLKQSRQLLERLNIFSDERLSLLMSDYLCHVRWAAKAVIGYPGPLSLHRRPADCRPAASILPQPGGELMSARRLGSLCKSESDYALDCGSNCRDFLRPAGLHISH